MDKNEKLKEEALYPPVRTYFEELGYTVNSEVMNCDVTAVKENLLVVVEMKTRLNLDVILQAVQRQKIADYTYIAVPKNRNTISGERWRNICHLLRRLELGLLLVSIKKDFSYAEEAIRPVAFDRSKSISVARRKRKSVIHEIHERHGDYNTGGSSRKKLVTSYRELAIQIAVVLMDKGPCSVKEIKKEGKLPDKIGRILINNHYGWFDREKRGIYRLSEKAGLELENYRELVDYFRTGKNDLLKNPKAE